MAVLTRRRGCPRGFKVDADKKGRPMIRSLFPMAANWSARGCRHLYHEATQGRAGGGGMAGSDGSLDPGSRAWRSDVACADRGVMRALSCHVERLFESSVKKSIFGDVASACLPVLCDFVEAGPESPVHAKWARATGSSPGRAFVANCAGSPAIDDTSPVGCAMAARAASIGGLGRAED